MFFTTAGLLLIPVLKCFRVFDVACAAAYISSLGVFRHIFFPSGGRIISLPPPGVASQDSEKTEPGTTERAVHRDGIDKVLGTAREKAATAEGAGDEVQRG